MMKRILCLVLSLIMLAAVFGGCAQKDKGNEPEVKSADEMLSLWTADATAKKALVEYLEAISDASGADYIPVEDRIAVFDLDGTLFCETDPNYFDYTLLVYRVLEDPDYKDKASDFEKRSPIRSWSKTRPAQNSTGLRSTTAKPSPPRLPA